MADEGAALPAGLIRILADCFVLRGSAQVAAWCVPPERDGTRAKVLQSLMILLDATASQTSVRLAVLNGTPSIGLDELFRLASCKAPRSGVAMRELALAILQVVRDFHMMGLIARESGDEATAHLLFSRVGEIEEAAWRVGELSRASGYRDDGGESDSQ